MRGGGVGRFARGFFRDLRGVVRDVSDVDSEDSCQAPQHQVLDPERHGPLARVKVAPQHHARGDQRQRHLPQQNKDKELYSSVEYLAWW